MCYHWCAPITSINEISNIKLKQIDHEKMNVKGLSEVIMLSANPERLAKFYNDVMGIPLAKNQHGDTPDHFECEYLGIRFAILKLDKPQEPNNNIVPSFYIVE